MNSLQKALVNAGLADTPKARKYRQKTYNCAKCGAPMVTHEGTNIMACTKCSNYFVFDGSKPTKKETK